MDKIKLKMDYKWLKIKKGQKYSFYTAFGKALKKLVFLRKIA